MHIGKVKWFNNAKGFGFTVSEENTDQDLCAHYSTIQTGGYKSLKAGQPVHFNLTDGPKGPQAINITPLQKQVANE